MSGRPLARKMISLSPRGRTKSTSLESVLGSIPAIFMFVPRSKGKKAAVPAPLPAPHIRSCRPAKPPSKGRGVVLTRASHDRFGDIALARHRDRGVLEVDLTGF